MDKKFQLQGALYPAGGSASKPPFSLVLRSLAMVSLHLANPGSATGENNSLWVSGLTDTAVPSRDTELYSHSTRPVEWEYSSVSRSTVDTLLDHQEPYIPIFVLVWGLFKNSSRLRCLIQIRCGLNLAWLSSNTHRLTVSDYRCDVTLSIRRPWRHFMQKSLSKCPVCKNCPSCGRCCMHPRL